jgi:type IV secretion system protein VirB10
VAGQANTTTPAGGGLPAPDAPPAPAKPAPKNAGGKPEKTPEELLLERRLNSPLSFEYEPAPNAGGVQGRPQARPAAVRNEPEGTSGAQGRIGAGNELGKALTPTEMTGTTAAVLFDRNYLISRGTFLDCALETEINSSAPGMTSCILTKNIYSANGNLILLDRGSKLTGQYQGGLRQGQARIFVLWTRVETPTGVVINIDSPGTGPLGASGHDGYVDNHFFQRFGGAIMLSLVEDAASYYANRDREAQDNQTNISFGNTQDATESMAKESLKNTINIPPTLHKNHGDHINVFVARDLDFRTVYGVDYE